MFWGQNLYQLLLRGGPFMWPLVICSVFAVAIALERLVVFMFRSPPMQTRSLLQKLNQLLEKGEEDKAVKAVQTARGPVARVVECLFFYRNKPPKLRDEIVNREASQQLAILETRLNWLATIGHLSPMLGLLGTVAGLISCFHSIELQGGQVQPGDLASGIWQALLTTVFGLCVALPSLATYQFFDRWAGNVALQMQWAVSYLHEWLNIEPDSSEESFPQGEEPNELDDEPEHESVKSKEVGVSVE
ncbi:Outer membrane transport energization protein ExbB [Planctomycetales bacterium 10988]|nr:Outer membrane transport energization protein ExbB [Planctomycetales bacterium 10988]